ncbi:hypothetical protein JJB07_14605 [Tumebacillus sp. ITR2]|uniref:Uncharacterized protein n=1 Tax=Tumebacillus amylolyticus TaxID=2801339 RepID=A0ABS1JCA8_9BACL|nr:hypothetical protein [Tumebacillus amylolyticus]MBL0387869.1 hypothetical protein [Tumebacillus amylolyticus]
MPKQLSETVRFALRAKKAKREYKDRLDTVQTIMKNLRCGVNRACDTFLARKYPHGNVPDDVIADINDIRKELATNAATEQTAGA